MGLLTGLLLLAGVFGGSALSTNLKQDKMLKQYEEDFEGQNTSSADPEAEFLRAKIRSEVFNDWYGGKRKLYPKEYIAFFELNSKELLGYQIYLINKKQWEQGVCQSPKQFFTLSEWTKANSPVKRKIKHFNETGEMIW